MLGITKVIRKDRRKQPKNEVWYYQSNTRNSAKKEKVEIYQRLSSPPDCVLCIDQIKGNSCPRKREKVLHTSYFCQEIVFTREQSDLRFKSTTKTRQSHSISTTLHVTLSSPSRHPLVTYTSRTRQIRQPHVTYTSKRACAQKISQLWSLCHSHTGGHEPDRATKKAASDQAHQLCPHLHRPD